MKQKNRVRVALLSLLMALAILVGVVSATPAAKVEAATPTLPETEYVSPKSPTEPTPYDGVPVTPGKISASNYRSYGLTDDNWSQYNGYYAIRDAKELYGFAEVFNTLSNQKITSKGVMGVVANAVLLSDIVINTSVDPASDPYSWTPIGVGVSENRTFAGVFDGNGYSISGVYQNYSGTKAQFSGLFSMIGCATVKNLVIKNSAFYASEYVGAILSINIEASLIEGIRVEESVSLFVDGLSSGFGQLDYISAAYDSKPFAKNIYVGTRLSSGGDVKKTGMIADEISSYTFYENVYYKPGSYNPFGNESTPTMAGRYAALSSTGDAHVCAPIVHNQVNGTCERSGLSAYTFCAVCEKILSGEKTVLYGHGTDEVFYTLSKTDSGKHDKRCLECTEILGSVDHRFNGRFDMACEDCGFAIFVPDSSNTYYTLNCESYTLTHELQIINSVVIPEGCTFTVSEGVTFTVSECFTNHGTVVNNGGINVGTYYYGEGNVTCGENAIYHPKFNDDGFCLFCENEKYPEEPPYSDGYYEISKVGHLMWFSNFVSAGNTSANAKLTADITFNEGDLSGLQGETDGYRLWVPIGMTMNHDTGIDTFVTYTGTFDGDGHTISGLYHFDYWSYGGFAGLVSKLGAGGAIKNVTIKDSYFATSSYVGAIVGDNLGGTVENCHNVNTTIASAARAGGIVGHISSGTVRYCTNTGTVKAFRVNPDLAFTMDCFGGIAGNTSGTLEYCTNNGIVTGESMSTVGGISGQVYQGIVRNNVNNGNVTVTESGTNFGGIVGYQYHGTLSYNINYGTLTAPGDLVGGVIGNPLGNGGRYTHNYTVGGNACGVVTKDGCYSITEDELANGRFAFELGIGQEIGKDARPYVGGPAVYAYFDASGVVNYTNDANYTCHHAGGTATCDARAVCDGCRNPYGEIPEGSHKFEITGREDKPNCTVCGGRCGVVAPHNNNYIDYCAVCGDWIGPALSEDGFYEISTFGNLMWFQEQVNAGNWALNARLMNNISGSVTFRSYDWKPIGGSSIDSTDIGYEGIFDGQGYNISLFPQNMTPEYDGAVLGLFGTLKSGAIVKNLSISNRVERTFSNKGTSYTYDGDYTVYVGMVAGRVLEGATVSGCRVANGSISISGGVLGAIVGVNYGTVENCVSYGMTLAGPEGRVGGIVGDYNGGTLINCYTTYTSLGSTASGYVGTATDSEAGVSDVRMASGEITYIMNSYVDDPDFWYQTVGSGGPTGRSEYNVIGKIVYAYDFGVTTLYSNSKTKFVLSQSLVTASGETFTIPAGMTVEIPAGITLTNSGTLIKNGTLNGEGTLNGFGNFLITEINPELLPVIDDIVYDGKSHANDVIVTVSSAFSAFGKTFTPEGYTFYKSFTEVKDVGYYEIGYVSESESYLVSFNVTALAVEEGNVYLEYDEVFYNGIELQPEVDLSGFDISLGRDYIVTYENNVAAGVATATVTFRGNFSGEVTKQFTISSVVIGESAVASVPENVIFTGAEVDPVTVTVGGIRLVRDIDYTVTYENNTNIGQATATVVGIGNVSGEASFTFQIIKPSFTVTVFDQILPYNEDSNVKPFDQTMYEGEGLVDGHTVVLGEPIVSGGTDEMITVLQILDANGEDVLEYYDITILATGKYHMFYESYDYDNDGNHWRNCVYNCDEITDYGTHVGEPATCVEDSKCTLCDAWYQFATGLHTWVDSICSVCGTENPYEVWIDTDGNGQFNGDEVGRSSLTQVLAYGESGTYKLAKDPEPTYVGGVGLSGGQNIVIDLNGRTFTITGIMSLQHENTTITFIDTSPAKSGKIVGTGETAIWITDATSKVILDGVSVEGLVSVWAGELELKGGATATSISMKGGTAYLYEGYDLRAVSVTPESDGTYTTKVYIGEALMAINAETGALECSADHVWTDADCTTAKTCTVCYKTDGEPLGHDTNGAPTCEVDEYCSRCEAVINAAIGHSIKILDAAEPTCDTVGYTQGSCCANCGEVYVAQIEIPALGHTAGEPVLAYYQEYVHYPTCTLSATNDYITYCTVCDDELSVASIVTPALGHTEVKEVMSKVDPTCVGDGWIKYKYVCIVCDYYRTETVDVLALGHTPGEAEVSGRLEPTCTYEGFVTTQVKCAVCDHTLESNKEILPILEHTPNIDAATCLQAKSCTVCYQTIEERADHTYVDTTIEATCTEDGGIKHSCSLCGYSYMDVTASATGHSPDREAPTCTEDKKCSSCGEILQSAEGHSLSGGDCTVDGYCTVCGEVFTAATGHSYNIEEANCIQNKYCYNCGHVEEAALGHSPDRDAPTCTESVVCTRCPALIEHALGHDDNIDVPTCTEDRYCLTCGEILGAKYGHEVVEATCETDSYCALCGEALEDKATGHSYVKETIYEGDCNQGGEYYYRCENCNEGYYEYTDVVPHTPTQWPGQESTCISQGYEGRIVCGVCGTLIEPEKTLPFADHVDENADGCCDVCGNTDNCIHSWDGGSITQNPNCTEEGEMIYTCTICGEQKTESVDANGHNYVASVTAPTCTEKGYTTYNCSCGHSYVDGETPSLGHSFTNYVSNNDGTKTAKCDRCDVTDTQPDTGSEVGRVELFREKMAELSYGADTETTYSELYELIEIYSSLSENEKEEVDGEFKHLQQLISNYNENASTANEALDSATEVAFAPIATSSFTFLAALWFILKKKFLV
ncbi:MAG: hypothetical protein IJW53_03065 [Clostridia bacterium]|nr:hypothetical protein [Clostridia bacterium]